MRVMRFVVVFLAVVLIFEGCKKRENDGSALDPAIPQFGGLTKALAESETAVTLRWSAASDDETPDAEIVYQIFVSTGDLADFSVDPDHETDPGATSYIVTGLAPKTVHTFMVRAQDGDGNTDSNSVVRSVRTTQPAFLGSSGFGSTVSATPDEPSLAYFGGTVYVGWTEQDGGTSIAVINTVGSGSWGVPAFVQVSGSRLSKEATAAFLGSTPHLIWSEGTESGGLFSSSDVYVKRFNGPDWSTDWELLGGSLTNVAPGLTPVAFVGHSDRVIPTTPHVAFQQIDTAGRGQIFVKRWNEAASSWSLLSGSGPNGSINVSASKSGGLPVLFYLDGVPYVAWTEGTDVIVKRRNETDSVWEQVGSKLNSGNGFHHPWIEAGNGSVYASWHETSISGSTHAFVAKWNGTVWERLGDQPINLDLSEDAEAARVSIRSDGTPYALWIERDEGVKRLFLKEWSGSSWIQVGGVLNFDPSLAPAEPHVAGMGTNLYMTWNENSSGIGKVYVRVLD